MNQVLKWAAKSIGLIAALFLCFVAVYLGVAQITARLPREMPKLAFDTAKAGTSKSVTVYLISGLLHVDIAMPVSPYLLDHFAFFQNMGLPMKNPNLKYLSYGWGSKAFYTTAGSYSDITASAVLKAVIGDQSVLRVVGLGDIKPNNEIVRLKINAQQYERMISSIEQSFRRQQGQTPIQLTGVHLEEGDAFFPATGNFNLFNPCNQWVNKVLHDAGIKVGKWTPTTQSLFLSLRYFEEIGGSQP